MRTLPNFPITPEIEARFWSHVRKTDDADSCWEWQGGRWKKSGYGVFKKGNQRYKAHRVAYAIQYGKWPDNLTCHTCDNPKCVRGSHLFDGTNAENLSDMVAKGRSMRGIPRKPEAILRGERNPNHHFTEQDILTIRSMDLSQPGAKAALARELGVSKFAISAILHRKTWRHLP
jgi:hypothetical protein